MNELEEAAIGWAVTQLIYEAAVLTDGAEWERLSELFAVDAVLVRPTAVGAPIAGRSAILASFRARPPRTSVHLVHNIFTTIISANEVTAVSRVTMFTGPATPSSSPALADPAIMVARFEDRVRRDSTGWRFARRFGTMLIQHDVAAHRM
jgi:hypothetical protein